MRNPDNPPSDPKRNGAEKCRCNDHPALFDGARQQSYRRRQKSSGRITDQQGDHLLTHPFGQDIGRKRHPVPGSERLERPRVPVFRLYDIDERPHGAAHLNHQPIESPRLVLRGNHFARGGVRTDAEPGPPPPAPVTRSNSIHSIRLYTGHSGSSIFLHEAGSAGTTSPRDSCAALYVASWP